MEKKILIVDDEAPIRSLFKNFLGKFGFQVVLATHYEEGVAVAIREQPDLVLTDIMLGARSGLEMMRSLRQEGLECPIIIITGFPNLETATEAIQLGAFDYLVKPVHLDRLLKVVNNALEQYKLRLENETIRANLQAVFQSVQDAIITVDNDLSLLEVNEIGERLLGLTRAQLVGKNIAAADFPLIPEAFRDVLKRTIRESRPITMNRVECSFEGGKVRLLNLNAVPLKRDKNRFGGGVLVIHDETHLANLETGEESRKRFHRLCGASRKMREVYSLIEKLADTQTTVLIQGESGTGKELTAEALHLQRQDAKSAPLVRVNCAALPDNLLESELFGHVKGAFTGATQNKIGRFELANNGTIFLDEIGDISPQMQLRLLRVIQEREFERLGDTKPIRVNFRLVAATHQDLARKVREGSFREDLYYRLKVVVIRIPPLREVKEDIPLLVNHFIEKFNQQHRKKIEGLTPDAEKLLLNHSWPGNVRELEHAIEHAFIIAADSPLIQVDHLPSDLVVVQPDDEEDLVDLHHVTDAISPSAQELLRILENCRWNKTDAARILGINRRTLYRRMKRLGLEDAVTS